MVDKTKSRGQVAGIRGMPRLRLRALRREPAITWDMSPVWSFRSTPPQRPDEGCAPSSDDYRSPASLSMLIRRDVSVDRTGIEPAISSLQNSRHPIATSGPSRRKPCLWPPALLSCFAFRSKEVPAFSLLKAPCRCCPDFLSLEG